MNRAGSYHGALRTLPPAPRGREFTTNRSIPAISTSSGFRSLFGASLDLKAGGNRQSALLITHNTNASRVPVLRHKLAPDPSDQSQFGKRPQSLRSGLHHGGSERKSDN